MKLYHGTSEQNYKEIMSQGRLKPRRDSKRDNWNSLIKSRDDMVFLTNAYSLYYAVNAISDKDWDAMHIKPTVAVIFEIDTNQLDQKMLCADGDALEQIKRHDKNELPGSWTTARRKVYYQEMCHKYRWDQSIQSSGLCAYQGTIKREAFSRVALINLRMQSELCFQALDMIPDVKKYSSIEGVKFRTLSRWIFGDSPLENDRKFLADMNIEAKRDGIEIINLRAKERAIA
jgi:hypothetical protein